MCMLFAGGAIAAQKAAASKPAREAATSQPGKKKTRILWTYAPKGSSFNGVLTRGGNVFALDRSGKIHALDAASGDVLWQSKREFEFSYGFGMALSPHPDFPALLVGGESGLCAFDLKTGKKLWHTAIAGGVAGPACTMKAVIAGGHDGQVYACALKTGKILWRHDFITDRPEDPKGFDGAKVVFDGKAARPYNASTDGKMVLLPIFDQCRTLAIDASTGKRLWDFRSKGWMSARPEIGPRNVFVGSQDTHFYALDKVSGKLQWKVKTRSRVSGAGCSTDRFAYFGSCDANLYSVDQVVGKVMWKFRTDREKGRGSPIYSRPLVRGDAVYVATLMNGKLYALNRHTGKLLWKLRPVADSDPTSDLVSDGKRLFVTTRCSGFDANKKGKSAVIAIDMR